MASPSCEVPIPEATLGLYYTCLYAGTMAIPTGVVPAMAP